MGLGAEGLCFCSPLPKVIDTELWEAEVQVQSRANRLGRRRGLPLVLCTLVASCYDPNLPDGQVWTSQHFRYAVRADDSSVCGAVVDRLEAHLQALNNYLGLTWTGGTIGYYKFRDSDDFRSNSECPSSTIACATPRQDLRSQRVLDGHELIHIYTRPLGRPPTLFEEGVAEALSPEGRTFLAPSQGWRDIVGTPHVYGDRVPYTAGGWFVSYLLQTFGPAPFVAFYRAAALDPAPAAVAEQFSNIYGLDLDAVWGQAQANKPKLAGVPVWECASANPMVKGNDLAKNCDGTGAFAAIELAEPASLRSEAERLDFIVSSCSVEGGLYAALPDCGNTEGLVALPVGKYYLAIGSYWWLPRTIPFREVTNVLGPDCTSLSALDLPSWRTTLWSRSLVFSIANSAVPWFVKLQFSGGEQLDLKRELDNSTMGEPMVGATVEACDSCQGPCHVVGTGATLRASSGTVLRFTNLTAPDGATVAILGTW